MIERRLTMLDDDTVVNALVGHRRWKHAVVAGEITLHSVFIHTSAIIDRAIIDVERSERWPKSRQPLEARCECGPGRNHNCGIYAYTDPSEALSVGNLLGGEVELWGWVIIHRYGFRAQFARPSAIYVNDEMTAQMLSNAELVAYQYSIPLVRQPW